MSDLQVDPQELLRIIGELEVVRRMQAARVVELEQALAAGAADSATREKQERG